MRRSLRAQEKARGGGSQISRKKQRLIGSASEDASDEERGGSDGGGSASESEQEALESEASDSADEWRPDERQKGGRKDRGQRGARHSSGETEEDASDMQSQDDVEEDIDLDQHRGMQKRERAAASRPDKKKKVPRIKDAKLVIPSGAELFPIGKPREKTHGAGAGIGVGASASSFFSLSMDHAGGEAPEGEETEAAQRQEEAKRMWEEIRARKAERVQPAQGRDSNVAASNAKSTSANGQGGSRAQRSVLDYMPEGDNDHVAPILWPTSTPSSRIEDRASLFIGFVYSLSSSRRTEQTRVLTHLSREVHPSLPSSIFPEMFANMRATQRGSMHDMYAWRVLKLKRGRDGLSGPGDWEIDQGCEDDGEKAGGRAVLRAIEKTGASDVLVIVSR
ncbi:IMPACT FAMILY MEMBER YIGZ [Ceraceosorus bombacis]|uniref:IMPACT FAMILY MEMBER YIGZ n=1 Tax=Ceraceosorus bombacis TaxID=401625 RepID=A0A0P1B827_9BASI|nr:IMPACT FAMILY MEMBER YIGZ [Ceraceosorus bombacis]